MQKQSVRRQIRERILRREAKAAINAGARAVVVLLTVLAQRGGEVTITQGTLDQCTQNLNHMDFGIFPGATEGEFIVRLLEGAVSDQPGGDAPHAAQ